MATDDDAVVVDPQVACPCHLSACGWGLGAESLGSLGFRRVYIAFRVEGLFGGFQGFGFSVFRDSVFKFDRLRASKALNPEPQNQHPKP